MERCLFPQAKLDGKRGGCAGVATQPAWLSGICPNKARVTMLTTTSPCHGRSCANDVVVICFIRAISQDAVLCYRNNSVSHLALWPTSIMGSDPSDSSPFYNTSRCLSAVFSPFSCPQRDTVTRALRWKLAPAPLPREGTFAVRRPSILQTATVRTAKVRRRVAALSCTAPQRKGGTT